MIANPPSPISLPVVGSFPSKGGKTAFVALSAVLFVPSIPRFFALASSFTVGLLAACFLILGMGVLRFYRMEIGEWFWPILTAIVLVVTAHGLGASFWFTIDVWRGVGSIFVVLIAVITAYQLRAIFRQVSSDSLERAIWVICGIFLLIAIFSILGIQPNNIGYVKPIFPFSEPSHYALGFSPFILFLAVRLPNKWRVVWLSTVFAIALLLESLSLVVAIALVAVCCLPAPLLAGALFAMVVVINNADVSYFSDRLDFSVASNNASTLVYIQGVELISEGLRRTSGWGVGFQQIGIVPLNVPTTELIYRIIRDDANLLDGGFLAAKIIAEMGCIGIFIVAYYCFIAFRSVLLLRRISRFRTEFYCLKVIALSTIVMAAVEVFVRGVGYFSGTFVLLIAMILLSIPAGFLNWKRVDLRLGGV